MATDIQVGREFDQLPIQHMIAGPLVATVQAQAHAAQATRTYIESLIDPQTRKPIAVNFSVNHKDDQGGSTSTSFDAPLLSIVPVPHLRIDSLDIDFKYTVSQTIVQSTSSERDGSLEANAKANWGWGSASITVKGHMASKSSEESTVNRSGTLNIRVHASEAPMPEGLARVLSILANTLESKSGGKEKA